jgi:hypothetical protein
MFDPNADGFFTNKDLSHFKFEDSTSMDYEISKGD